MKGNGRTAIKLNTSIVMTILLVVLCVAALSTATFAWFSSNSTVNLTQIEFTAATNSEIGNSDLYISWNNNDIDGKYELSFAPVTTTLVPMMPKTQLEVGMSYEDFIANFNTAGVTVTEDDAIYVSNGRSITPYTCSNPTNIEQGYFFVKNGKTTDAGNSKYIISIKYEMTGDLQDLLKVAVFNNEELVGVLTNNDTVYYGNITAGTLVSETEADHDIAFLSDELSFEVTEGFTNSVRFVAWYDGVDLQDDDASKTATLTNIIFVGTPTF